MYFNIPFQESKDLICFFGNVINVFAPAEVMRYCDPQVFSGSNTFKFCVVEEVL